MVRRRPERDGNESAAARGRRQLFAIVPPVIVPPVWFVCMSKVILSFRFYSRLGLPARRRSGSIALDRDEAKSTSSARVLESLLNLFWWPFLPLFHCKKECLSVPCIRTRRLFWVVFFLLAVHLVATYGRKPISQSQKNRIFQT